MIKLFIRERLSWILFFFMMHFFILFIAYIDSSIPVSSILYIVFISSIVFLIFCVFRYHKETKFYQGLKDEEDFFDSSTLSHPLRPFEKIVQRNLMQQLEQAKKDGVQTQLYVTQEKDELLAWIHEIKTPLTAMHLIIERLENREVKANLTFEWLRIHFLLDQQLHQKRIFFIENDMYIEHLDLESLIFNEIKTLQAWCMQKNIGFDLDLQAEHVLCDAKWLSFIMRQLLTNAVKYSEESDVMIRSYKHHGQVYVEVKDSGRGISPQDMPRIFDKGFTSTTQHEDSRATGMGLYLAQKAAHALSIHIGVKSVLNEGTTFTLAFPKSNDFVEMKSM
ncbi:sensor histidine kinase [Priestia aryabhattai]|uniref:sensor histidine kinase n=1 Tax=Priestia aryabhattai TaxID=412384 RepID=UPI001C8D1FFE|nr:sensor histidine kinase [Priestia aryabhattai]MBY0029690.1 sensor histidine kinase [Priestia aryabhattai]